MLIIKTNTKIKSNRNRFSEKWTDTYYCYEPNGQPMTMPTGIVLFPFKVSRIMKNFKYTKGSGNDPKEISTHTKEYTVWLDYEEIRNLYDETENFINYVVNENDLFGCFKRKNE